MEQESEVKHHNPTRLGFVFIGNVTTSFMILFKKKKHWLFIVKTGSIYGWSKAGKNSVLSYICEIPQSLAYRLTMEQRTFGKYELYNYCV